MSQRGKCNKRRTQLLNLGDAEIKRRAKDMTLPVNERRAYQQEEKWREKRNKQKRRSS